MLSKATLAHFALAAVALIYGANYIIAKSVMPQPLGPNSFIILRVLGAAILFWIITARGMRLPDKADIPRFALCGLTGVAVNQLCFFNGLAITSPINTAIIMTSNPILVMLISAFALKQRITLQKTAGVVLGAIGAVALLLLSANSSSKLSSTAGDLFILVNSISYAFYLVLVKPLMNKYRPLTVITWVFTFGLIYVLPFGLGSFLEIDWSGMSHWQWFAIFYVIVCVTFLTYLLNILAIHILSPTITSAYIYFQPILAAVFAYLFAIAGNNSYVDDIGFDKWICAGLIFAGIYLVSKRENTAAKSLK
jgi:drug/metabolite transporter (DMT)-like permease